ncbi:nuclear transport factor 2 family protein [Streptomyces sp. TRM70350]|uniref:nuclear transport factor 2 family protein n=1 Tax=Streptomyces sp. TRM70350 TaxID=2856165 RepID=UPI001C464EE6|nr:nuclear transport factor 2 family protein [Streptomyces sp. TRM70350]MBV7698637.1 nuclear transport factor 2 family protein [Streptomyces sp. TRM70350]
MTDHHVSLEIQALVHRLFRALDARDFAVGWMRDLATDDVRMETPVGTADGVDAVGRLSEEAVGRFVRTQHMASGILVDVEGDRADASWNAHMTHVHDDGSLFTVGGRFDAEVRRTPGGWRFSRMAVRPVWTQGRAPEVK